MNTPAVLIAALTLAGAACGVGATAPGSSPGYIGVGVKPADDATAAQAGLSTGRGEIVQRVQHDGPAYRAGIRAGDVVTKVDNDDVGAGQGLTQLVMHHPAGASITLSIVRDHQPMNIIVRLDRRPSDKEIARAAPLSPTAQAAAFIDDAKASVSTSNGRLLTHELTCAGSVNGEGPLKIAALDGYMQGLVNNQQRFPPYMQANVAEALSAVGIAAGRLRLELADGLLAGGCPKEADQLYRFVVSNFTSEVFSALRQRALVGIEDVRTRQP